MGPCSCKKRLAQLKLCFLIVLGVSAHPGAQQRISLRFIITHAPSLPFLLCHCLLCTALHNAPSLPVLLCPYLLCTRWQG